MAKNVPKPSRADLDNQPQVVRRVLDSYLAFACNSVGSRSWSQYYADIDGVKTEIVHDGARACAYFVSSVLRTFNLIELVHMTVPSVLRDMVQFGWTKIDSPRAGAIVAYENIVIEEEIFPHIGICIATDEVISNSDKAGAPVRHELTMTNSDGSERAIAGYYWHDQLEQARG